MIKNINLQKEDFISYNCPKHIDQKILGKLGVNNKKTLKRISYIIIPSLVTIGTFFVIQSYIPVINTIGSNLTKQDRQQIDIVLDLFEESVLEVQNSLI